MAKALDEGELKRLRQQDCEKEAGHVPRSQLGGSNGDEGSGR